MALPPRMGPNHIDPESYLGLGKVGIAVRGLKQRIPGTTWSNNAKWREELGRYTVEDFDRYLLHKKMSFTNFKSMIDRSTFISNAKKWIDNNPPVENYMSEYLYNKMEVGQLNGNVPATRSRSRSGVPLPVVGGRRKRTQKRVRRNRRATARFFVRGK